MKCRAIGKHESGGTRAGASTMIGARQAAGPALAQAHLTLRDLIRTRGLLAKVRTMIQTFLKLPLIRRS